MFFRKYLAFVQTTFPWVFCCVLTWWADRLFVEIGHRPTDSPTCSHSDLVYVHWHQAMTLAAVLAQCIHSTLARRRQFKRELTLIGVGQDQPCMIHLYALQIALCTAWATIVVCLIDVSPWLCIPYILDHRAIIALSAFKLVITCLGVERYIWERSLRRAIRMNSQSVFV